MQALNVAIVAAIEADTVLSAPSTGLLAGGVHLGVARPGTATPYLIYQRLPGPPRRRVLTGDAWRRYSVLFRAVTTNTDSATVSGPGLAWAILERLETAVRPATLSISGWNVGLAQHDGGENEFTELVANVVRFHHTVHWLVELTPS